MLWEDLEGAGGEGGGSGIGMGKTCKLKDISFQCMTKLKKIIIKTGGTKKKKTDREIP